MALPKKVEDVDHAEPPSPMHSRLGLRFLTCLAFLTAAVCGCRSESPARSASPGSGQVGGASPARAPNHDTCGVRLPAPFATPSADKQNRVLGWPAGKIPTAAAGLRVTSYAEGLVFPRWLHVLPNGDVLVAEARSPTWQHGESPNRITLLRDGNRDGIAEGRFTFAEGLNMPFGMMLLGEWLYVANTDAVVRYRFKLGQTRVEGAPERILSLPSSGYHGHWTRNLIASLDGKKIYVSVGSASNVGEKGMSVEERRANILEMNPDGSGVRVFASGIRNPVGMAWAPTTGALWTSVNERDELGDDLVPDYLTSVRDGAFYGWPYAYIGPNEDPRHKGARPDLVARTICPDVVLGAHTASLGLHFYRGKMLPSRYREGAFVAQHGSWNRAAAVGYKVIYIPFKNGVPAGPPEDFLTGFLADPNEPSAYGRPVGLAELADGSMLVTDDEGARVWRISVN